MSDVTVKQGDTHDTVWKANADLTGATVRLLAQKWTDSATIELAAAVTDAAAGLVTHQLTGTLPVGSYRVELEVTRGGRVTTFPSDGYGTLRVVADL